MWENPSSISEKSEIYSKCTSSMPLSPPTLLGADAKPLVMAT